MKLKQPASYSSARELARKRLPRVLFDFIDGGADDEVTLRANREAFERVRLVPRTGTWNATPQLSTRILGEDLRMPVLLAPTGGLRLVAPEGDMAVARAARSAGLAHITASGSGFTLEEIASRTTPGWFQLYKFSDRDGMMSLAERAQNAGYRVLVLTFDTATSGNRERDVRNGFSYDLRPSPRNVLNLGPQLVRRPRWLARFMIDGMPVEMPNTASFGSDGRALSLADMAAHGAQSFSPGWEDLRRLRESWLGPIVVKGVMTSDDARRARDHGADGVVVSNHGGRQLDGLHASMEVLPGVADAVGDELSILVDSGVRRGSDVIKALACGADGVLIGRLPVWGLAAGGESGVDSVLENLRAEMIRTLCLLGCDSVAHLDRSWIDLD